MSRLGFDKETGMVYEGRGDPSYPIWPTPVLAQATLIESPTCFKLLPHNFETNPFAWMFREDSFDPVSRVRRGRLFQKFGNSGWENTQVEVHPALSSDMRSVGSSGRVNKTLGLFIECTELLSKPNKGEGARLAIGGVSAFSLWRIIQTERTVNQDVLVTLRAESAFGILPDLDLSKINPESIKRISSAIARVLDAAYRELPTSVVDQCRNAATVLISRWMYQETSSEQQEEKDLGAWINTVRNHFKERPKIALCSALDIISKLHPRGKDNELEKMQLRAVTDEDAEFAVHTLGFIIREIGWSKD
ncbi:hypothetical protein [Undibacterium sp. WLHG33]|uniref:hypothetical protein n=1 Tax=Undibacterium sp. WLHG33 TaxID=3412482 RepID=UPI003C30014B